MYIQCGARAWNSKQSKLALRLINYFCGRHLIEQWDWKRWQLLAIACSNSPYIYTVNQKHLFLESSFGCTLIYSGFQIISNICLGRLLGLSFDFPLIFRSGVVNNCLTSWTRFINNIQCFQFDIVVAVSCIARLWLQIMCLLSITGDRWMVKVALRTGRRMGIKLRSPKRCNQSRLAKNTIISNERQVTKNKK